MTSNRLLIAGTDLLALSMIAVVFLIAGLLFGYIAAVPIGFAWSGT